MIGSARSPVHAERVPALGGEPIPLDLLDARTARKAVLEAEPEVIVHQATALASARFSRSLDRTFAPTNRLRTQGTDALLAAARAAGVRRGCQGPSLRPMRKFDSLLPAKWMQ